MKGLLIKDIINLKQQGKVYLFIIALFAFMGFVNKESSSLGVVLCIYGAMLPVTAYAYDEKSGFEKYALTMPLCRRDLVFEKYLLGIISTIAASVIGYALSGVSSGFVIDNLIMTLVMSGVGVVYISIMLPVIFKFGVEKARFIMLAIIFLPTFGSLAFSNLDIKISEETLGTIVTVLPFALPTLVVVGFAISLLISLKIYKHREF